MSRKLYFFVMAAAVLLTGCTNVATFDYNGARGMIAVFQEKG